MDIFGSIFWVLTTIAGWIWSILWFLLGGWLSTLAQALLVIAVIFYFKYGAQRAPAELWRRARSFGRFLLNWIRAREPADEVRSAERSPVAIGRAREFGDINVSTVLSLLVIAGLLLLPRA